MSQHFDFFETIAWLELELAAANAVFHPAVSFGLRQLADCQVLVALLVSKNSGVAILCFASYSFLIFGAAPKVTSLLLIGHRFVARILSMRTPKFELVQLALNSEAFPVPDRVGFTAVRAAAVHPSLFGDAVLAKHPVTFEAVSRLVHEILTYLAHQAVVLVEVEVDQVFSFVSVPSPALCFSLNNFELTFFPLFLFLHQGRVFFLKLLYLLKVGLSQIDDSLHRLFIF